MQISTLSRLAMRRRPGMRRSVAFSGFVLSTLSLAAIGFAGDQGKESPGFVMELSAKESDVLPLVKGVAEDSIIRGTYAYERDKTLAGANPAKTSDALGQWNGPGQVFYKVVTGVPAPRHFINSNDVGTVTVRYVVQPVGEARTRVRIDAVFIEDGRRKVHLSDGTVESSEFKAIQDKVQGIQLAQQKALEEQQREAANMKRHVEEAAAEASALRERQEETARLEAAESSIHGLEQRLHDLQREVELRVKANTALKTAPFQKSADQLSLGVDTDVVILIVTPKWYGVETPDGRRGWLRRNQAEPLP